MLIDWYGYAPDNKRVWKRKPLGAGFTEEISFYIGNRKLGTYRPDFDSSTGSISFTSMDLQFWFGGRKLQSSDRVGSNRTGGKKYTAYGTEITSTANDTDKFGTYYRDQSTNLDYADQRFYASTYGRFKTVDQDNGGVTENHNL